MNQEIKQNWINGLRNGIYKEGNFSLRTAKDEFSVFGVLCDIVLPEMWNKVNEYRYSFLDRFMIAPNDVIRKSELTNEQHRAIEHMRIDGLRFADIADYIEEFV